ncbi:hypothetical protein QU487_06270 [Crenobacter sp. SG2305]|uniref:hypothetical protein n=1 Tax=Crenobacter oryzisoli TaxID=3056844 RepID=UPI0025AAF927|nr:hypothetical protein [Crenobacter sp. SG2305]MDN0082357.1 hypothetical protein [Crenobacter sp. SG2305]
MHNVVMVTIFGFLVAAHICWPLLGRHFHGLELRQWDFAKAWLAALLQLGMMATYATTDEGKVAWLMAAILAIPYILWEQKKIRKG